MKHFIFTVIAFVITFVAIQFLVGSTGTGTTFSYGHADGPFIFLSIMISGAVASITLTCSLES